MDITKKVINTLKVIRWGKQNNSLSPFCSWSRVLFKHFDKVNLVFSYCFLLFIFLFSVYSDCFGPSLKSHICVSWEPTRSLSLPVFIMYVSFVTTNTFWMITYCRSTCRQSLVREFCQQLRNVWPPGTLVWYREQWRL